MQNINGTLIPWPDRAPFLQNVQVAEELDRLTDQQFAREDFGYMPRLELMARTNGLEIVEAQDFIHNATVVAMQQLTEKTMAKLTPSILKPVITASLNSANAIASKNPSEMIDGSLLHGARQVPSIVYAKSTYFNVRSQDYSVIQDEPKYISSLGLGVQPFQPFAWLFVERESSMDVLHRFRNPFETTLFTAVRESLKNILPGKNLSPQQSFLSRFGFGVKR